MKRIIILLSVLLLLPVWSQAEIKQPGDTALSKGLTPYVPEISTDHAPKVRQLAKQLLALIDSMHTEEDFSVQSIQKNSGIRLKASKENPDEAYFGKKLTKNWKYIISRYTDFQDKQPVVRMSLSSDTFTAWENAPDVIDVCLDLGQFQQALKTSGYYHSGNNRGSSPGIQYRRDLIEIEFTYVSESRERMGHDCIRSFSIYIDKPEVQS